MASIMTNATALTALQTLKRVSGDLAETQSRISTGLKVASAKDNAAYFSISATMKADVSAFKAINENLTMTRNAVTVARTGAQSVASIIEKMVERIGFAQTEDPIVQQSVKDELANLAKQAETALAQSTFNGVDLLKTTGTPGYTTYAGNVPPATGTTGTPVAAVVDPLDTITVVTGVTRTGASGYQTTTFTFQKQGFDDILGQIQGFSTASMANANDREALLQNAQGMLTLANKAAGDLGLAERTISNQQTFIGKLVDEMNVGIGAMIDADMNEESTRLQAFQVQQQLATQALSIANQAPQSILSLFR